MKNISFTDFKKMPVKDIKEGQCLKVTGDGEMVFYVVIKPESVMRDRIEALCSMIDASRGF